VTLACQSVFPFVLLLFQKGDVVQILEELFGKGVYAEVSFWWAGGVFDLSFGAAVWALVLVFYVVYNLSVLAVWELFYYVVFYGCWVC
jgi:hypothetical protein